MAQPQAHGLHRYTVFAAVLAAAGLPLYIHAPKFFVDEYGLSLTAIGSALLGLRVLDFLQDPLLGWLADNLGGLRGVVALVVTVVLAGAMVALFAMAAPVAPLLWFVACLAVLFTAFSFLSILFYARGIGRGDALGAGGHLRVASWRESGSLIGICLAAILPSLLLWSEITAPLAGFALGFAVVAGIAGLMMIPEWRGRIEVQGGNLPSLLRDPILRKLLVVALFNAAPAAVSASLFLFFVEYRLGSEVAAGPLLLIYFLSAACAVPVWSRIAAARGAKWTLMAGMMLAIFAFSFASLLGEGDLAGFAVICVGAGAALGADMTLLPALFSARVDRIRGSGGQAFGLWNFCSKFTLAVAAATVLPLLDRAGFEARGPNPPEVLAMLTLLYAVVPSVLKTVALAVLWWTPIKEEEL